MWMLIGISGTMGMDDGFNIVKRLTYEEIEAIIQKGVAGREKKTKPEITEIILEDDSPKDGVVELPERDCITGGRLKAHVKTKEGRNFMLQLQCRFDDTGHQGYDLHLNVDLDLYDEDKENKIFKPNPLKGFISHHVGLYPLPRTFRLSLNVGGHCIVAPVAYYPTDEDFEHIRIWKDFITKHAAKSMTEEAEIAFKESFRNYSVSIRKRMAEISSKEK